MTEYLKPITYNKFKEEVQELGGTIYEKDDSFQVLLDDCIFAEIYEHERCAIRTNFGYVTEFDSFDTDKLTWLVARLCDTPLLDREEVIRYRYELKMLSGHPYNYINVDLTTKDIWLGDPDEWGNVVTSFTDSEIEHFPEEWQQLFRIATKERVDS